MKDLFPGFYRKTNEQLQDLWLKGIFIFDTSVLLNLYEYSDEHLTNIWATFEKIKKRIWLPHHVAWEYQRGRTRVIDDQFSVYDNVIRILTKLPDEVQKANKFKKPHHGQGFSTELRDVLRLAVESIKTFRARYPDRRNSDDIRDQLDKLYRGRIGKPYTPEELRLHYEHAAWRFDRDILPGYMDKGKDLDNRYGDAIIWFQIMAYAEAEKKSIIFITDDEKEDWWLNGEPRPELRQEILQSTTQDFYMYTSDTFLEKTKKFLKIDQPEGFIEEAREIRQESQQRADFWERVVRSTPSIGALSMATLSPEFTQPLAGGLLEAIKANTLIPVTSAQHYISKLRRDMTPENTAETMAAIHLLQAELAKQELQRQAEEALRKPSAADMAKAAHNRFVDEENQRRIQLMAPPPSALEMLQQAQREA